LNDDCPGVDCRHGSHRHTRYSRLAAALSLEESTARELISVIQLARMRAISTGPICYIDFDYDNSGIRQEFYTCYLYTDGDGQGEINNGLPDLANEFRASLVTTNDSHGGVPVVLLPGRVDYGADTGGAAVSGSDPVGDGVAVDNDRLAFYPDGRVVVNTTGSLPTIYFQNIKDQKCAVQVNMLGRIQVFTWDGSGWVEK